MLSVSDVNRSGYIVNRYSRLAVQARACLSCSGTDKWNIFEGLNQRKMGFHLLAYPFCRSHREMIACRSSSPCLFLSHSLNVATEPCKGYKKGIYLLCFTIGCRDTHNHIPSIMDFDLRRLIAAFGLRKCIHKLKESILKDTKARLKHKHMHTQWHSMG